MTTQSKKSLYYLGNRLAKARSEEYACRVFWEHSHPEWEGGRLQGPETRERTEAVGHSRMLSVREV